MFHRSSAGGCKKQATTEWHSSLQQEPCVVSVFKASGSPASRARDLPPPMPECTVYNPRASRVRFDGRWRDFVMACALLTVILSQH
jgi:hypothetical protein